jgi:hypothetical protein
MLTVQDCFNYKTEGRQFLKLSPTQIQNSNGAEKHNAK